MKGSDEDADLESEDSIAHKMNDDSFAFAFGLSDLDEPDGIFTQDEIERRYSQLRDEGSLGVDPRPLEHVISALMYAGPLLVPIYDNTIEWPVGPYWFLPAPMRPTELRATKPDRVYFVREIDGPVRIFASQGDPERILREMQSGNSRQLALAGALYGTERLAQVVRDSLFDHHIQEDWFNPSEEVLAFAQFAGVVSQLERASGHQTSEP